MSENINDLKKKTISGIVWATLEKFGVKIISFITNIILARVLSPDDYGCVGMLMIFILLALTIVEGGFASALIQKQETSKKDESTMFYWNIVLSFFIYLIIYYSSAAIASYYKIPHLEFVLQVQGLIILVNAFGIVPLAVLRKNLKFKQIAVINTISVLLSVIIALFLAFKGYGIWSLVWQQTSLYFFITILAWYYSRWTPRFQFSFASLKSMFAFGGFLLLSNMMNTLCDNIQGLIIGRLYSASCMGFYSQAKKLEEVPTTSISQIVAQVTFPVFSKIQDNKSKLYTAVRKSLIAMNNVNIPLMILLIIIAKPLFIVLFSEKWLGSVHYFQILCLSGIVNCGQSINYQVVVASGRSKEIFYWNLLKRIIGICLISTGIIWGVEGILGGMVIGMYITYFVNAQVAYSTTGYSVMEQLRDMLPCSTASLIACCSCFLYLLNINTAIIQLLLIVFTYLSIFILASCFINKAMIENLVSIFNKKL